MKSFLYRPRRGPGKAVRHPLGAPLDEHGTPIMGTDVRPSTPEPGRVGPTKRQRYAALRAELAEAGFPTPPTRATLRRIDRDRYRAGVSTPSVA